MQWLWGIVLQEHNIIIYIIFNYTCCGYRFPAVHYIRSGVFYLKKNTDMVFFLLFTPQRSDCSILRSLRPVTCAIGKRPVFKDVGIHTHNITSTSAKTVYFSVYFIASRYLNTNIIYISLWTLNPFPSHVSRLRKRT